MIDSACGLDLKHMSEAAKQKRVVKGLKDFNGIEFGGRFQAGRDAERDLDAGVTRREINWGDEMSAASNLGHPHPSDPGHLHDGKLSMLGTLNAIVNIA